MDNDNYDIEGAACFHIGVGVHSSFHFILREAAFDFGSLWLTSCWAFGRALDCTWFCGFRVAGTCFLVLFLLGIISLKLRWIRHNWPIPIHCCRCAALDVLKLRYPVTKLHVV